MLFLERPPVDLLVLRQNHTGLTLIAQTRQPLNVVSAGVEALMVQDNVVARRRSASSRTFRPRHSSMKNVSRSGRPPPLVADCLADFFRAAAILFDQSVK